MEVYEPLNVPKAIADNIWVVDGSIVRMSMYAVTIPFTTRMTIVRLENGDLWCHSPIELTPELQARVDALGPVRHLISPNKIHYAHIQSWVEAYPEAIAWASPGVRDRAAHQQIPVTFHHELQDAPPVQWAEEIDQLHFQGSRFMDEVVFFHRSSHTLILADLIENFELNKVSPAFGALLKVVGVTAPHGKTPLDLRMTFWGREGEARPCFERMMQWQPEKIVLSHGQCFEKNGTEELQRAFQWVQ